MANNKVSMEWSIKQFNRFIKDFIVASRLETGIVLRKFMVEAVTRFIFRTPVDTGRARAGWTAAADALGISVPRARKPRGTEAFDPGSYQEHLEGDHQYIIVSNNVSYILPLEYGWSKQAPYGMVRVTLAELRSGEILATDLMNHYAALWGSLSGAQRYRTQRNVLGEAFGQVKNMPLPQRRPKP